MHDLLLAFGSAVAGGLLGTFATISHERGAEFRSRMLAAAEDFLNGADRVSLAFRMPENATWEAMVEQVNRAAESLSAELSRVDLLFGRQSLAARNARSAWGEFRGMGSAGVMRPDPDDRRPGFDDMAEHHANATQFVEQFSKAAVAEIHDSWSRRTLRKLMRTSARARRAKGA